MRDVTEEDSTVGHAGRHCRQIPRPTDVPDGGLRATMLERGTMSLGNGVGILKDRVFRIGHVGGFSPLQPIGTLGGIEPGLRSAGIPHHPGGVQVVIANPAGNA